MALNILNEVHTAASILKKAVDKYLATCLILSSQYKPGITLKDPLDLGAITSELEQIASFEQKIDQTKRALGKLRNSFRDIVPINSLPPEILSHVFRLTHTPGRCLLQDSDDAVHGPSRTPESLSQVCSYWRFISLDTYSLWTHIDLSPQYKLTRQIIKRAELFAARSAQLSLSVHVDVSQSSGIIHNKDTLLGLCSSIAARATSIQLHAGRDVVFTILQSLLAYAIPGKLTRLDVRGNHVWEKTHQAFIRAGDRPPPPIEDIMSWEMDIPQDKLEEVFRRIVVLRLDRVFPYWTSQAYHGLTKLHLSDLSDTFIAVSHLAGILRSSPQLRYLHLGAGIQEDITPEPVLLDDLEVLQLELDQNQHHAILDLVKPGLKPLRMSSITYNMGVLDITEGSYRSFFERANVAQLHVGYPFHWKQLDLLKLLRLIPNARLLSTDSFQVFNIRDSPSESYLTAATRGSQLELCVVASCINFDAFRQATKALGTVDIALHKTCWIEDDYGDDVDVSDVMDQLTDIYPGVRLVHDWSPPEENWG